MIELRLDRGDPLVERFLEVSAEMFELGDTLSERIVAALGVRALVASGFRRILTPPCHSLRAILAINRRRFDWKQWLR